MRPQKKVLDRVLWRVMPYVTACMVIGTIDRSNVGFAKLSMTHDLGMSEAVFALGSSLFYVGYIAFEIPSALGAHTFGARLWFARFMLTWGLATLGLAFTSSTAMFYVLRLLLGVAEAGLYRACFITSRSGSRVPITRKQWVCSRSAAPSAMARAR